MTTDDAKTYLSKREIPRLFESLMTGLMYHRPTDHIKYLIDCLTKVHDKGQENITWSSFVDIRRSKTPLPPISNDGRRPSSKGSRPTSRTRTPKGEEILSLRMGNIEDSLISRVISPASSRRIDSPDVSDALSSPGRGGVISPITDRRQGRPTSGRTVPGVDNVLPKTEEPTPQDVRTKSPPLPAIPSEKVSLPDIPIVLVIGAPGSDKDSHIENLLSRYPGWQHLSMGPLIKEEVMRRGDAHSKFRMVKDLLSKGEVAPEDVTIEVLQEGLKKCQSAKGVIVTGFPRNMQQVGDYERKISRVDVVFMIDCEEAAATDRLLLKGKNSNRPEDSMSSVATRINYFKAYSLAAAKHYDDQGKLVIIDGDSGEEAVRHEIGKAFDKLFFAKGCTPLGAAPPKSASSLPSAPTYKGKYEEEPAEEAEVPLFVGAIPQPPTIVEEDTGRKEGLPTCPIIFVAGGPGSGKGTQCARIIKRYPGFVHLSMGDIIRTEISTKGTADEKWGMISQLVSKGEMAPEDVTIDLLKEQLKENSSAKAFVIEGFPRDKNQVEAFNKHIGGLNFVMLFDCEEFYMQARLVKRGKDSGRVDDNLTAISNRINFYKYNTLPVMKYFDDLGKLVVIDADRDMEELFYDISRLFDFAFFGKPADEVKADTVDKDDKSVDGQAEAAMKIQAGFRGYMVRSGKSDTPKSQQQLSTDEDKLKVKSKAKVTSITEESGNTDDKEIAALKIKAGFHALQTRKEEKSKSKTTGSTSKHKQSESKPDTDKETAIQKIQAGFQGLKVRHEQKNKENKKEKAEAATRIQAGYRGYRTRQKLRAPDTDDNHQENKKEKAEAATRIQAGYRGYRKRQKLRAPDTDDHHQENKKEKAEAATRIQAGYRGYRTRQKLRAPDTDDHHQENKKEKAEAATRIQAGYRGYRTRQKLRAPDTDDHHQDSKQATGTVPVQEVREQSEPLPIQEEVIEATITNEESSTTGNNIANPSYSQALDENKDKMTDEKTDADEE